ncbi:MAG: hypothetical protein IPO78_12815 [Saprospiraceae bacterium]|nr:hypothetical protein [Saprospiraceae bacterium]MBK9722479.1 hypothetical protein [Saprospiraceae bacterium]
MLKRITKYLEDLLPYLIDVREDDRYEGNLSEEEIEWLVDFAENKDNQAGKEIRSALDFYYGIILDGAESFLKRPTDDIGNIPIENVEQQKQKTIADEVIIFFKSK